MNWGGSDVAFGLQVTLLVVQQVGIIKRRASSNEAQKDRTE